MRVTGLIVAALPAGSAQASSDSSQLFRRDYVSTAVLENGSRHPLFEGTKIRVDFSHSKTRDGMSWRADCNHFGSRVEITERRLFVGQIIGTEMACQGAPRRQDRWMLKFFSSGPRGRLSEDGRLRLRAGDRVIRLRPRRTRG